MLRVKLGRMPVCSETVDKQCVFLTVQIVPPPENCNLAERNFCAILTFSAIAQFLHFLRDYAVVQCNSSSHTSHYQSLTQHMKYDRNFDRRFLNSGVFDNCHCPYSYCLIIQGRIQGAPLFLPKSI